MSKIRIDVSFYNEHHAALLRRLDEFSDIQRTVTRIEVDTEEFLILGAFKYQRHHQFFRTREDLKKFVPRIRNSMLDVFFDLESGTVRSNYIGQNRTDNDSTETCGVAAGLAVANQIFGLMEADWERLDVSGTKNLDFQTKASDRQKFVIVETKGRTVQDPNSLDGLSGARRDIEEKKLARRTDETRDVYLGLITSFPIHPDQNAMCRLVDPPIEEVPDDPVKYKLLARLSYYHRELGTMTRANFLIALANRIQAISLVDNYKQLDGYPLLNTFGERLAVPDSLFSSKSVVRHEIAFGEVIPLRDGEFYFYGFMREVIEMLIGQKFPQILSFEPEQTLWQSFDQRVTARIPADELEENGVDIQGLRKVPNSSRLEIEMNGTLTTTTGGHVVGVVRP